MAKTPKTEVMEPEVEVAAEPVPQAPIEYTPVADFVAHVTPPKPEPKNTLTRANHNAWRKQFPMLKVLGIRR